MYNQKYVLTFNMDSPESTVLDVGAKNRPGHLQYTDFETGGEFKNTVVILLGWTGAIDKQLEKYSVIYSKKGCITIRCIIPVKVVVYDRSYLSQLASQLVNFLKENSLQSHPLFFHVFSTGGAFVYSFTLKEIASQKNPDEFNIRGTIFDSSPFWPTFKAGYTATLIVLNSHVPFTFGLANLIAFLLMFYAMVTTFWAFMKRAWVCSTVGTFQRPGPIDQKLEMFHIHDYLTRIWKLQNHALLFLYSETDVVTPYREVEEIAGALQDRGNYVQTIKFDGSAHVQHYKKFPQEYTTAVTDFIEGAMESYNGPAIYWDEYN